MPYFEYFEATWLGSSGTHGRPSTPLLHDGLWNQYEAAVDGGQKINNAVEAFESRMGFFTTQYSSFSISFRENKARQSVKLPENVLAKSMKPAANA